MSRGAPRSKTLTLHCRKRNSEHNYTSCEKDGRVGIFSKFIMSQEWDLVASLLLPVMQVSPVPWVPPCPLLRVSPYQSPPLPPICPTSPSLLDPYRQYLNMFVPLSLKKKNPPQFFSATSLLPPFTARFSEVLFVIQVLEQ